MKKAVLIILYLIFLAGISFASGGFIAYVKNKLNSPKNSGKVIQNIIPKSSPKAEVSNALPSNAEEEKEEQKSEPAPVPEETTAPENKFSFAILGDTQYFKPGKGGGYPTAVYNIKKMNPDIVFALGDLVSSCDGGSECEGKYTAWKNVLGSLASKTYPAQGNHDRTGKEKADAVWEKVFSYLPGNGPQGFIKFAYSFDFENSHFVVLDSDKPKEFLINETQRSWLDKDLSGATKENIFVFFHEPAYPTNSKIGESLDTNPKDRDALWNIFVKYKVSAVFSGHEHIQSRRKVDGIYQFVFGNTNSFDHLAPKAGTAEYYYIGQAFGMVEANGTEITVKTYSVQGKLLNSFTLPQ